MGTSVGGAVFGQIASFIQSRGEAKVANEKRLHDQTLAANGQLKEYYKSLRSPDGDASFSHTVEFVIGLLAVTICTCMVISFIYPETIIYTLNPEEVPKKLSFLWGIISYERTSSKIIEINAGGVGLMLAYPVVFILSAVCTGVVPRKMR